ncbi:MAG: sigma-70 family RNA polymerase sigma factor [Aestuariivirgaceae bacterium]
MSGSDEIELAGLLRAAIAGDERSYAAFLEQVSIMIRSFLRQRVAHQAIDPEDVVQETLLAVHLKRHTWISDAPVMPWLYAIARHKLVDALRRRGRRTEIGLEGIDELAPDHTPEPLLRRDLERVLDMLTPAQRAVVAAISVEGCSIAETARRLGKSETAIRVSLHRGLSAISARFRRD